MSEEFKVPEPVSVKRPVKRPVSPQPSTSTAPYPPLSGFEQTADVTGPPYPPLSGLEQTAEVAGSLCPPLSGLEQTAEVAGPSCPPLSGLEQTAEIAGPSCPPLSGLEQTAEVAGPSCPPMSGLEQTAEVARASCPPLSGLEQTAEVAGPSCPPLSGLEQTAEVAGASCPPLSGLEQTAEVAGASCPPLFSPEQTAEVAGPSCPPLSGLEQTAGARSARPSQQDSVYSHVDGDISSIGKLRGLKSGHRRGRWLRLQQAKIAAKRSAKITAKYEEAIQVIQPLVTAEIVKQQTQLVLITAALDNFANTVERICDTIEGKKDPNNFTERLEAFKKKAAELREKRRAKNPNAAEFLNGPPPPPPKLSEEETMRRLRLEMEAAIEALSSPDKPEPPPEERYAHILEAFNKFF